MDISDLMVTSVQIWIWANYLNLMLIVLTCRIYADRLGWKMGTMLVTVRNVVCEGYVFTGVCLSMGACIPACLAGHQPGGCPGPDPRWGVCVSQHALRQTSPSRRLLLRYASYWNAFLFNIVAMGITDWIQIDPFGLALFGIGSTCGSSAVKAVVTARKQSLGQGNIFISVCQEFCPWGRGGLVPGGSAPGGLVETPPGRLLLLAVRILLECILVSVLHLRL